MYAISDDLLQRERDVLKSMFAASNGTYAFGNDLSEERRLFPQMTRYKDHWTNTPQWLDTRKRILQLKRYTDTLTVRLYETTGAFVDYEDNHPYCCWDGSGVYPYDVTHFSTLRDHWQEYISMSQNFKAVTVDLNLNVIDVQNHDYSRPVYIEKYQSYFFVSKFMNYVSGKITKVELIKLN